MTRETSIETYRQIEAEGLLGQLQFQVYSVIFNFGPLTQGETWKEHFPTRQRHDIAPRFAELSRRGAIQVVGERPCRVTGRTVLVWDVTSRLPEKTKASEKVKCEHCNGKGYFVEPKNEV